MLNWLRGDKVDHPLANPKDAKRIVDELPYKDPQKTLDDATYWLTSVNDTPEFRWDKRYEALDLLDAATRKCQDQLLAAYVTLAEGDRAQERRLWKTCCDYWNALGTGYLLCVEQASQPKAVAGATRALAPLAAGRALRALRQQLKWALMRYAVVRADLWRDVARCVAFAEAQGVMSVKSPLYPGLETSPCHELLRTMMLWAASPSGLSPAEQDVAERVVSAVTPRLKYDINAWDGCEYCFDLEAQRSPLRLTRSTPVSPATRYFDGAEAHATVQEMAYHVATTGDMPRGVDPGPAADAAMMGRVLKHLSINWAKVMPARAHERRKTAVKLDVSRGYASAMRVIAPETGDGLDFSGGEASESWVAEDVSAGGFGIVVPVGRGDGLRVGSLLALRSEVDPAWCLGVIRRVKADDHRQHRIGVQLISRSPLAMWFRTAAGVAQGRKPQSAILLSPRVSGNGSLHVLAGRDLLTGRETLEASYGEPVSSVHLDAGGVVESGHDFDWLRYKLLPSLT
jgi:hypothetical protein